MSHEEVLPPQNIEAEQCVLGSMLLERDCIGEVLLLLTADDFYLPEHSELFRALVELYDKNMAVDLTVATGRLKETGQLERVGGVEALVAYMEAVTTPAHAVDYAQLVLEASERRQLVQAASEILRDARIGAGSDVEDIMDRAEQRIFAIAQGRGSDRAASMKDLIETALRRIDAAQDDGGGGATRGLTTHFSDLDRMLNGLAPGSLYVVAGRPSMGKTSLALSLLDNICVRDHVPAVLFTLEVTREQVAENMLCGNARVDAHRLMKGELSDEEYRKVPEAAGRLSQAPLYVDDTPGLTLTRLRAKARRMKARHDIGLVVVDYLQLLRMGGSVESRQVEISLLSGAIKQMARELEVPVIALSQLNRAVEARTNKRPLMGDLRESGAIEQDADAVLLLYREEYYNPDKVEARGKAELILAKNRNGPTGAVDLYFFPNMMRFENPTFIPDDGGTTPVPLPV